MRTPPKISDINVDWSSDFENFCIFSYEQNTFIRFGQQVCFLKRTFLGNPLNCYWCHHYVYVWLCKKQLFKKSLSGTPLPVGDIIKIWPCDFGKSQYIQIWIGYGHQVLTAPAAFGVISLSVEFKEYLIKMLVTWLLCGYLYLHIFRFGWATIIICGQQVHYLDRNR